MKLYNDPRFNDLFDGIECTDSVTNGVHAILEVLEGETFDYVDREDLIKHRRRAVREIAGVLRSIADNGAHNDILEHPLLPVYRVSIDGVQQPEEFVDRQEAVVFGYDKVQKIIRERKQLAGSANQAFGQPIDVRPAPTFEVVEP